MACDPETCLGCYYGVAPHRHDLSGGSIIGSTRLLPREEWPANFDEDPEDPGCGIYHCDRCCTCARKEGRDE